MNRREFSVRLVSMLLVSGSLVVAGCTNSDYDFDQIDSTIGIGGNGLELPNSSTADIKLKDVLDLEENGVVVEDAETHDYVLRQQGNNVAGAHPYIAPITVSTQVPSTTFTLNLSLASAAARGNHAVASRGSRAGNATIKGEADIYALDFHGNKPSEVVDLSAVGVNGTAQLHVGLRNISNMIKQVDKLVITFPSYMQVAMIEPTNEATPGKVEGNTLVIENLSTAKDLYISLGITGLDFTKGSGNDKIAIEGNQIQLKGNIHMALETSLDNLTGAASQVSLTTTTTVSNMQIESATGKFDPEIKLDNLGSVSITGVPDFLKDGNVVADLYNPIISLSVKSNLSIEGKVSGKLKAVKNGQEIAAVDVPEFTIRSVEESAGTTLVYICRSADGMAIPTVAQVVEIPNLSDIVKTIPDQIRFECNARANSDKEGTFRFGEQYIVQPEYSIDAPIAFGENAVIAYNDKFDGWNKDIKDYQLADGASIEVSANVSNGVPAYLQLEAVPVGLDGKDISSDELKVVVTGIIAASQDGKTPVTSPLSIKITQKKTDAFKKLDGLRYLVKGKASDNEQKVTGITLNAERHTLKLTDIKVKLVGKVIADLN